MKSFEAAASGATFQTLVSEDLSPPARPALPQIDLRVQGCYDAEFASDVRFLDWTKGWASLVSRVAGQSPKIKLWAYDFQGPVVAVDVFDVTGRSCAANTICVSPDEAFLPALDIYPEPFDGFVQFDLALPGLLSIFRLVECLRDATVPFGTTTADGIWLFPLDKPPA